MLTEVVSLVIAIGHFANSLLLVVLENSFKGIPVAVDVLALALSPLGLDCETYAILIESFVLVSVHVISHAEAVVPLGCIDFLSLAGHELVHLNLVFVVHFEYF